MAGNTEEFRHGNGVRILPLVGEIGCGSKSMMSWCDRYDRQDGMHSPAWSSIVSPLNLTKRGGTRLDGNKFVKGRKRHIVVDVLGLVLGCYVTAANVADVKAAPGVLVCSRCINVLSRC